jgi:hypothetical protein
MTAAPHELGENLKRSLGARPRVSGGRARPAADGARGRGRASRAGILALTGHLRLRLALAAGVL